MSQILVLFLLTIVSFSNGLDNIDGRIVGGENAFDQTDFAVRIVSIVEPSATGRLFSGVAISSTRVITVAQAVFDYNRWIVGSDNLDVSLQFNQESFIGFPHPDYNAANLANNVGIIYVEWEIGTVHANIVPPAGFIFLVLGYGLDSTNGPTSSLQMKFYASVLQDTCVSSYNTAVVRDSNFCGEANEVGSVMGGDQGGPVINTGRNQLFGIVSFWDNDWETNDPQRPAVFVRLIDHMDFISSHADTSL